MNLRRVGIAAAASADGKAARCLDQSTDAFDTIDWLIKNIPNHNGRVGSVFGTPRPAPTTRARPPLFDFTAATPDGYRFYLDLGPLSNVNAKYLHNQVGMWNDIVEHQNYDAFWQARDLRPRLNRIAPAVLTVGGWFDAEDLFGALAV